MYWYDIGKFPFGRNAFNSIKVAVRKPKERQSLTREGVRKPKERQSVTREGVRKPKERQSLTRERPERHGSCLEHHYFSNARKVLWSCEN